MSNAYLDKSKVAAQNQLVQWINEAGLAEGTRRAGLLRKAAELLVHGAASLLPLYIDHVLSFVADKSADVRKAIVAFIEEISKHHPGLLARIVGPLRQLLLDGGEGVAVQKRALQACNIVYGRALAWLADVGEDADGKDVKLVWDHLTEIKLAILNLIDSDNEGVRTLSVKFLEEVVVLQTGDDMFLPCADSQALTDEAEHIFQLLIKFHNSQHISSVNLMGCMSSLAGIARRRPQRLPAVVRAFTALMAALPPTLSQSQLTSVRKHLRMHALALVRLPAAASVAPALAQLLQDAGLPPHELARALPKSVRYKRVAPVLAPPTATSAKRARADSPLPDEEEEVIRSRLRDVRVVVELVTATLRTALPDVMPPGFAEAYEPVTDSGSDAQIARLARMLHALMSEATSAPSPAAPALKEERDDKLTLRNAVAKLQETSRVVEPRPAERAREPPTPTVPKLKRAVAALRLAELTRPVPLEVRERLVVRAVERILRAETEAVIAGAGAVRGKLLATFAAGYGGALRSLVLDHVLAEPAERVDLALAWLYEEYAVMQGFSRRWVTGGAAPDKHDRHYGTLLVSLLTRLAERGSDAALRRVLSEAPLVTDEAARLVAALASERPHTAVDALEELCAVRPPRATRYLSALLDLTLDENPETRALALEACVRLHGGTPALRRAVAKHALLTLGHVALPAPPGELLPSAPHACAAWTPALYALCTQPVLSLLPNDAELIVEVGRVYAETGAEARRALLSVAEAAATAGGAARLVEVLAIDCPRGAEALLARLLHLMADAEGVSSAVLEQSRLAYSMRPDVRLLLPALPALTSHEVLAALPQLVRLPSPVLRDAFLRLLAARPPPLSATALLVALHGVEVTGGAGELKHVIRATALCFAERDHFPPTAVSAALLTLAEEKRIPVLLLRSALQALTLYPALQPAVLHVLTALTDRQVWDNKVAWEGWVKCWARCLPAAAPLLDAVPATARAAPPLSTALAALPPHHRALIPELQPLEPLPPGME